jgi:hypothetical protein
LKNAKRNAQENPEGLKLYKTHHLLICVNDVSVVGENVNKIQKKNTKALLDAREEADLKLN